MVGRSNVLLSKEKRCTYRSLLSCDLAGDFLKRGRCSGSSIQRQGRM